jgi:hypothetical protein
MWLFPDERPLLRDEVLQTVSELGEIVFEKTLWPLVLTQHLIMVRKASGGRSSESNVELILESHLRP